MTAYYNENDPRAAAWLRELVTRGLIAPGDVDERSIEDVRPDDLKSYIQCHFFAGIGIWSYSLRQAGWDDARPVWTGSCPCQPFSAGGKGGGFDDERHLWPAFYNLIIALSPDDVIGEQVASNLGLAWLDLVSTDMENADYAFGSVDFCAAGIGAPHIRQRTWWWGARGLGSAPGGGRQRLGDQSKYQLAMSASARPVALERATGAGPQGSAADRAARSGREGATVERTGPAGVLDHGERDRRPAQRDGIDRGDVGLVAIADGEDGRMGDGDRREHQQLAGDERSTGLRGTASVPAGKLDGPSDPGSSVGELGDHGGGGRHPASARDGRGEEGAGSEYGLDVTRPSRPNRSSPTNGFWRDADWLRCRDDTWRPVEPGSFPLAHGASARVGRLRGYGNGIVAPLATAFIEAIMELRT